MDQELTLSVLLIKKSPLVIFVLIVGFLVLVRARWFSRHFPIIYILVGVVIGAAVIYGFLPRPINPVAAALVITVSVFASYFLVDQGKRGG